MEEEKITVDRAVELLNPDLTPQPQIETKRVAWVKVRDTLHTKIKEKRKECHQWFDKLWRNHEERNKLYEKLANELGIDKYQCHFSQLSESQLDKALHLLKAWWKEKYDI